MSDEEWIKTIKCGTFMDWSFGGQLRRYRIERNITLRKASRKVGYDPGNLSKLETGIFPPPKSRHTISAWCVALGFDSGMEESLLKAAYNFHLGKLNEEFNG